MNSKIWIRKALSLCLVVATMATYSMVTLANSAKVAGELLISGDETAVVKVNGEAAQTGRTIFSSSTIATPNTTGAIVNLGKLGKIELAPDTTLSLSFDENGISGDLVAGRMTVLNSSNAVSIKTLNGTTVQLKAGQSALATTTKAQDDVSSDGGNAWIIWALVLGGAAAGILIAATSDNNRVSVGGNSTVISPTR